MANQEHLDILKQGVKTWNEWRRENPDLEPDLSGKDFRAEDFVSFDFSNVDFTGSNFSSVDFIEIDFSGANLSNAILDNTVFEKVNLTDAILEGAGLFEARLSNVNFNRAILKNATLYKAELQKVNLGNAILSGANLLHANLSGADLSNTDLSEADLREANFTSAKLIDADLSEADLRGTIFVDADLSGANLIAAKLIETNFNKAKLNGCKVYGVSAWKIQTQDTNQSDLIITLPDEPTIKVDNLEVAQFIYLLLEHKKLRDVLNLVMERSVLILGRFRDGGHKLLQAIAEKLREMEYLPIIFDFDRPESRNLTETVMTLVGLSRFVIVDLSGPSVPNELRSTVPHFRIPFVPIIEEGREVYSMFSDFLENDWVLSPVAFTSKEHLLELLPSKVIKPAENKCQERQLRLKEIFDR